MSDHLIARIDTFTKTGRYLTRGQAISRDAVMDDDGEVGDNYIEAPSGFNENAVVEVSAIAPTGPNPQNPQQIAPDTVQTEAGYVQNGARLIGEVTLPEKQRIEIVGIDKDDDTQAAVTQALEDADADGGRNLSNEGTEGTVADVTSRLKDADEAELDRLEAAENDREVARKGVLSAIERERASR